jgi:hypothetical protein
MHKSRILDLLISAECDALQTSSELIASAQKQRQQPFFSQIVGSKHASIPNNTTGRFQSPQISSVGYFNSSTNMAHKKMEHGTSEVFSDFQQKTPQETVPVNVHHSNHASFLSLQHLESDFDFAPAQLSHHSKTEELIKGPYKELASELKKIVKHQHEEDKSRLEFEIQIMKEQFIALQSEKNEISARSLGAQVQAVAAVRNELEQAQDRIKAFEINRLHAEAQHRATIDQLQQEIGRLEFEKARSLGAQVQAVAAVRNELEQAQDRIKTFESNRLHAEAQHRATIDQLQQEIGRLKWEKSESLTHAVSQARLISVSQNDLEQAQDRITFYEVNSMGLQNQLHALERENQALQVDISKLKAEQTHRDTMARANVASTFEQAFTYINELGSDQESTMQNFRAALQQMQGQIDLLEVEKRSALAQVGSQTNLIATTRSDLENARLQICELVNHRHEAAGSESIIGLLQDKAQTLTAEKNDALARVASLVDLLEVARLSSEQSRLRVEDLERRERDVCLLSNEAERMQKQISTLELEKQSALAELECIREEAATKELKSFASFYALQRLSLQSQSAKMSKCHFHNFSESIEPEHKCSAKCFKGDARYQTQGVISEVGIRSRRRCHALSMLVPADSDSYRYLIYAYFMIAWAQFVTASKFHRMKMSIQTFRFKNRYTCFIIRIRRNFLLAKFFTIWKASSTILGQWLAFAEQ